MRECDVLRNDTNLRTQSVQYIRFAFEVKPFEWDSQKANNDERRYLHKNTYLIRNEKSNSICSASLYWIVCDCHRKWRFILSSCLWVVCKVQKNAIPECHQIEKHFTAINNSVWHWRPIQRKDMREKKTPRRTNDIVESVLFVASTWPTKYYNKLHFHNTSTIITIIIIM